MARLDDLKMARDGLRDRMETCESDQNYAVLVRTLTDVLKQIDDLEPPVREATALDEFTSRLQQRRAGSKASGGAKQA